MADYHFDVDIQQKMPLGQIVCGDVFYTRRIKEEGRVILVLSDGIGHGVKANVLATLTASMALNYSSLHTKPDIAAHIFMRALPRSRDGKESYATFTIIEIEVDGMVRIVNYDNPPTLIFRNGDFFAPREIEVNIRGAENVGKILRIREFKPIKGDRIIFMTDGVVQSGLGGKRYPMGWGLDQVREFVQNQIARENEISATRLSKKILNQAAMNDLFELKDDTSCGIIHFRQPREFMLITGPPFYKIKDFEFVKRITEFPGKKIICGGTTAEIVARELDLEVQIQHRYYEAAIPPVADMEGFEMVTEGILTMGKVEEILESYTSDTRLGNSPPEEVVKLLMEHDIIHIIVGTRINWAHQDPDQSMDLEIRKVVVKRIVRLLEERFLKNVVVELV
ncbi:SpoIIE family protein phosphatase [Sunxiuqinia elliptica]|uniref:Stage II sporulation protein E n=1 Tax=Sunxiuqinia elliptica TaxID=655355 RepID=A0A1I2L726_9BACT|nr:SpoIIE family protein phosphatase [Sunxiuqinia elliptica]TDN96684.1 stage II sporulation protein E [Sunxiuqinia elliptica]TDO55757.1 stage II sporulation protein E [Sunxiuqinia elliptica]SFF73041.1 Stage II sporulation protein E (SpoIIE) [Sunxiuqinia elliptica]